MMSRSNYTYPTKDLYPLVRCPQCQTLTGARFETCGWCGKTLITSETWKDTYLAKLRESRETGRSLSDICQADPVWMKSHEMDLKEHGLL